MRPIEWHGDHVRMIDQRALPLREEWNEYRTSAEVAAAIREMHIRGAPAIGIAAAYGMALVAHHSRVEDPQELVRELEEAARLLAATRPTAVNLFWALQRMESLARESAPGGARAIRTALIGQALEIHEEDVEMCRRMGRHGAELISEASRVLTHCNAGALATGDYGTALGVIRAAHERGRLRHVWVDETRPFLQGARLTAWELMRDGIPCKLICDNMAGHLMQRGQVDAVITGADRVTAGGDVANKIGTYALAVLCRHHGIPFYVAAPYSTIDMSLSDGSQIPIEERSPQEVIQFQGQRVAPEGMEAANPAFDVTPAELVTALVTERGVLHPPLRESIARVMGTV
ncbi:MAG: S-methyl-5-thioribose-1-phosphate isomerase [Armatimonadetes bacterium]|nr:S-methyl-5-thioribose-1-phosphate isomerase [Armatimonadota bacterium]